MPRIFVVDDREQADPDPKMSVEEVRKSLQWAFPELENAEVKGPTQRGLDEIYTFQRKVGTKG